MAITKNVSQPVIKVTIIAAALVLIFVAVGMINGGQRVSLPVSN
jgi:hypothetical protein